jgi:hypothetical protein
VVEAEGVAAWRKPYERAQQEAIHNALMQAIEQACGVRLARLELGRNGSLTTQRKSPSRRASCCAGSGWEPLVVANGCLYVKVRAEVVPISQLNTPDDWREVWQTIGHPPLGMTVRSTGEPGLQSSAQHTLQTVLARRAARNGHPSPNANRRTLLAAHSGASGATVQAVG